MGLEESKLKLETSYWKGEQQVDAFGGENLFQTFPGCIQHYASTIPNKDAVVFCSTSEPRFAVSWKELYERSVKMAKAFINFGVKPGENVVIASRACPEYLYATFGAMMAAARVVNVVFTYKDGSDFIKLVEKMGNCASIVLDPGLEDCNWAIFKELIDEIGPKGIVSSSQIPSLRSLVFIQPPENENVLTVTGILGEESGPTELPQVNPDEVAVMFQTSGSTGSPKLVQHSHSNFMKMRPLFSTHFYCGDDIYFNDRPFSWVGGFPISLIVGQTRITVSGFCPDPENRISFMMDVINKERCTVAGVFPAGIDELMERQKELPSDWPLKTIWTGGQPITKAIAACVGKICTYLGTAYGGTEFLVCSCMVVDKQEDLVDYASGRPCPGVDVKVVGKDGSIVPINEKGEIYIRNAFMFNGYLNDSQKTAAVMTSDDWYKTDDYGRINADGYVFVEGRISDMIISGAMNVEPSILENVLKNCPGVESVMIVPVPDVKMYQVICACVTVKQGNDVTEDNLRDYMDAVHNDEQKMFTVLPRYYMIIDKFPESSNGKVSKNILKQMAEERFSA